MSKAPEPPTTTKKTPHRMSTSLQACARIERLMGDIPIEQRSIVIVWFAATYMKAAPTNPTS